jgi:hypothetical protein
MEKGVRALPLDSIPHSNASSLIFTCRFGPNVWVNTMVVITNPNAIKAMITIGK